jgi:mRNA-degrading endonuclease toxin of MazEF toxin-antitoxin module
MVGAIDARALGAQAGHLSISEMTAVDEALALALGLS